MRSLRANSVRSDSIHRVEAATARGDGSCADRCALSPSAGLGLAGEYATARMLGLAVDSILAERTRRIHYS